MGRFQIPIDFHLTRSASALAWSMITIQIGNTEYSPNDLSEVLPRLLGPGNLNTCVRVMIESKLVNLMLSSGECGQAAGGSRAPNSSERELLERWVELGLNQNATAVALTKFLKEIRNYSC